MAQPRADRQLERLPRHDVSPQRSPLSVDRSTRDAPVKSDGSDERGEAAQDFDRMRDLNQQLAQSVSAVASAHQELIEANQALHRRLACQGEALRRAKRELADVSARDRLTRLLNRRGLARALRRECERALREGTSLAAIALDLDDFSRVNRRHGAAAGDAVLQTVATRLGDATRQTDPVGRVGSDEFLILLPNARRSEASQLAEQIRLALCSKPMIVPTGELTISASFGVTSVGSAATYDDLVDLCDAAVRRSKAGGKNCVCYATAATPVWSATSLAQSVHKAESYQVVRQPLWRLSDGLLVGYEYLSRFHFEGLTQPHTFFATCDEHDLLTVADRQCFCSCAAASRFLERGYQCHINLFPSTLLTADAEKLVELLPIGRSRASYTIELSEQQLFGDPAPLQRAVAVLKAAGVRIAIDDVGFGRSCLETLVVLKPDVVKIDKAFVTDSGKNESRRRRLMRLVRVIEALDATAVAEGIETAEDLAATRDLGIPYGQGYYWGMPS